MHENEIATRVIGACIEIHRFSGPGLFESAYEAMLFHDLRRSGLSVDRQVKVPLVYRKIPMGPAFRADMIVEGKVILEIKSVPEMERVHRKQLLTYLKLSGLQLGLLLNFGSDIMASGIRRVANNLAASPGASSQN